MSRSSSGYSLKFPGVLLPMTLAVHAVDWLRHYNKGVMGKASQEGSSCEDDNNTHASCFDRCHLLNRL